MKNRYQALAFCLLSVLTPAHTVNAGDELHIDPLDIAQCQETFSSGQPVKVCRDNHGDYRILPTDTIQQVSPSPESAAFSQAAPTTTSSSDRPWINIIDIQHPSSVIARCGSCATSNDNLPVSEVVLTTVKETNDVIQKFDEGASIDQQRFNDILSWATNYWVDVQRRGDLEINLVGAILDRLHQINHALQRERERTAKLEAQQKSATSTLPLCTSSDIAKDLQEAVQKSPLGQTLGVELLSVKNMKETSFDTDNEMRHCQTIAFFNNGKRLVNFTIEWENDDRSKYYVQIIDYY